MGWPLADDPEFTCSCGAPVADCVLFSRVASAYAEAGLAFKANDFGTAFRVVGNDALNYYLTEALPWVSSTNLDRMRDTLVRCMPTWRGHIDRQRRANVLFMSTVLDALEATVFLDNSHTPYRLRHLIDIADLDIRNLHLVRDPRGVVLSMITNSNLDAVSGTRAWLRRQTDVVRYGSNIENLTVRYEDLCRDPNQQLSRIHSFSGLDPECFDGDFKHSEHHILGNRMRLGAGKIDLDERWRTQLRSGDRHEIERRLANFASAHPGNPLAGIINSYLEDSEDLADAPA